MYLGLTIESKPAAHAASGFTEVAKLDAAAVKVAARRNCVLELSDVIVGANALLAFGDCNASINGTNSFISI